MVCKPHFLFFILLIFVSISLHILGLIYLSTLPLDNFRFYVQDGVIEAANAEITNLTDQIIAKQNKILAYNIDSILAVRDKQYRLATSTSREGGKCTKSNPSGRANNAPQQTGRYIDDPRNTSFAGQNKCPGGYSKGSMQTA